MSTATRAAAAQADSTSTAIADCVIHCAHPLDERTPPPVNVLSWRSPAERNTKLKAWRRAVSATFAEQSRALRVAWALEHLFNARTGFAHPSNTYLARETAMAVNKVQEALAALETGGAIVRIITVRPGGQRWREIYPADTLILTPALGAGVTPTVGVGGHPQEPGVKNLRRIYRPRSQLEYARAASAVRDRHETARAAPPQSGRASDTLQPSEGGKHSDFPF